jgi:hypothetical protein
MGSFLVSLLNFHAPVSRKFSCRSLLMKQSRIKRAVKMKSHVTNNTLHELKTTASLGIRKETLLSIVSIVSSNNKFIICIHLS